MKTFLVNVHVLDAVSENLHLHSTVVLEENRIEGIYPQKSIVPEEGSEVFDLEGCYLLPGLWDVHVHPGGMIPDPHQISMFETQPQRTLRAARNAMDALEVGFTALRVTGDFSYVDIALADAFAQGTLLGPRLFCCGRILKATGGHGSYRGVKPLYNLGSIEADGPYAFRQAAREQLKMGAHQIKICISGGIAGGDEEMYEPQMTRDEMAAVVDVAHKKGTIVSAHAGGPEAIQMAIQSGVDCFEHGYYLDDETVEMMAQHDVFYVPTLSVTQDEDYMIRHQWPEHSRKRALEGAAIHVEGFKKALQAGVKIANGADLNPIAQTALPEIEQVVRCGMTPFQAIQSSTCHAAELCGVSHELGTVEPGKIADLIVVEGNPLEDITNLRRLKLVMKEGSIVLHHQ